jgi:pimeloyl-ACP methyl ester carboxylesterase
VTKSFARSAASCRATFFSADLPQEDLLRYQRQLSASSPVRLLDLRALGEELPLPPLPAAAARLPAFVGGGEDDLVVDPPAVAEAAAYFGAEAVMWPGMAHDCMLDTRWEGAAQGLRRWLDALPGTAPPETACDCVGDA